MISSRHLSLFALLLLTLGLVWFAPEEDSEPVVVKARRYDPAVDGGNIRSLPGGIVPYAYSLAPRQPPAGRVVDIFASAAEKRVMSGDRRLARPAITLPPPLPYAFVGTMAENGEQKIFLQQGEQVLVVRVGDLIGGQYQVLGAGQGRVDVLYLPANIRQTIHENKSGPVVPRTKAEDDE